MDLVSIKNLSIGFNKKTVLNSVSFNISKGDILAVIGPNGAGKTLLIRTILGLNQTYTGEIIWYGKPEISYVPQKMNFEKGFPLTVKEFFLLEMGESAPFWFPSKKIEEEIKDKLDEVKIGHLLNQRLSDLSPGEIQRMFIAYSMLENPEIIFFDEPASGIDIGMEETVYNMLYEQNQKRGVTIVLVSHELSVVYKFATKVVCLNQEMVCQGSPAEVLTAENLQKLYGHHTALHQHNETDGHECEHKMEGYKYAADQHDHE